MRQTSEDDTGIKAVNAANDKKTASKNQALGQHLSHNQGQISAKYQLIANLEK